MTRREALARLAPAILALQRQSGGSRSPVGPPLPADPGDLTDRIRRSPHERAFDVAAEAIRGGAGPKTILEAVFMAGIVDIRPRHVGGKLHAVLMVESVFQLAESTDRESAWLLTLWNLDDLKRSQAIDRAEGDWVLPDRPGVSTVTEDQARLRFLAAMEAWDDEQADRALVQLLAHHDLESIFEILWPLAARSYVNIGHKMIFAAQTRRVLERIGWRTAEPALRSLVHGLLYRPGGTATEAFERSRQLAPSLPAAWLRGNEEPESSREILEKIRGVDSRAAQDVIVAAFQAGLGPATVWDALRLAAAELFLMRTRSTPASDRAALLPVHPVTVVNAFGYAWRTARDETTRRLMILQAAAWLPALRDDLAAIVGLRRDASLIEVAGRGTGEPPADLEDLLREPSVGAIRAWLRDTDRIASYRARLTTHLAHGAIEAHQHKYAAALFEESRLVHPRWAPHLLACAPPYLPGVAGPETEVCALSRHALRKAGL